MQLHDAHLLSLELKPDHGCVITFIEEGGRMSQLVLQGIERLKALDFREGNIVLDLDIIRGKTPNSSILRILFDLSPDDNPDYFRLRMAMIEAGRLSLVHVIPSYGCEVIALCKNAKLKRIERALATSSRDKAPKALPTPRNSTRAQMKIQ